jgi:hypothetical protein
LFPPQQAALGRFDKMNQPNKEEEKMNQQKEEPKDQESLLRPKAGALSVLSIEKESLGSLYSP